MFCRVGGSFEIEEIVVRNSCFLLSVVRVFLQTEWELRGRRNCSSRFLLEFLLSVFGCQAKLNRIFKIKAIVVRVSCFLLLVGGSSAELDRRLGSQKIVVRDFCFLLSV